MLETAKIALQIVRCELTRSRRGWIAFSLRRGIKSYPARTANGSAKGTDATERDDCAN